MYKTVEAEVLGAEDGIMRALLILLALAFAADGAQTPAFLTNFYGMYDMPRYLDDAVTAGFIQTDLPEDCPMKELSLYCFIESGIMGSICIYFDDIKYIAGYLIAIKEREFSDMPLDMQEQGFTYGNITVGNITEACYSTSLYLTSPEILAVSNETRLASRQADSDIDPLHNGFIMFTDNDKNMMTIHSNASIDITSTSSKFTKQACVPWMGYHYYYDMTNTTECNAKTMLRYFLLVNDDTLIGVGMNTYGTKTIDSGETDMFEAPTELIVRTIVTDGPECLYDMAAKNEVLTMHSYFIKHPRLITCL